MARKDSLYTPPVTRAAGSDNFSNSQLVRKPVVPTSGGVVAAAQRRAAEVGAAVLGAGGDAIDAAVATSFALGVVEPWMSGISAGGCMVVWRAKEQKAWAIDYGMRAPRALDPAAYPLAGAGVNPDLFAWPRVKDDRNAEGAAAVAVPGVVAGMALAHQRFGSMRWRELVAPAVRLAREGLLLDWYSGLLIASTARSLARDPDAAAMFLEEGRWAPLGTWTALSEKRLDQSRLAAALEMIAMDGTMALYGGDVGAALVKDMREKGGSLAFEDLRSYLAHLADPIELPYRGGRVFAAPGMTGGPPLIHALKLISRKNSPRAADYARALDEAWRTRFKEAGDGEAPAAAGASPACTTHFSVADRAGNLCAVTQTNLSIFGARVVSPSTGVLMNNGIMWFDPEPGKPNSLGPGKRCLGNYCPVIGEIEDKKDSARFALGASGGRKILGTVLQLCSFLMDHGLSLEEAFHRPRIDVSGNDQVIADIALPAGVIRELGAAFPTATARRTVFPYPFAVPAGVLRSGGVNMGCTEIMSPWGDAVAERAA
jgi:gamma-glutamyltranspeptidase/glutathione hydrolase